MAVSAKTRAPRKKAEAPHVEHSFLDLNQLELALINRALRGRRHSPLPDFIEIGNSRRILAIQRHNLETLCRKLGREHRAEELEAHLSLLLSGTKPASLRCYAPRMEGRTASIRPRTRR